MEKLTIGQLAKEAGVSSHTVRFYERRGLLPRPSRTSKNYRLYTRITIATILFIKRAQELEFSLAEVKELLANREQDAKKPCPVRTLVKRKIDSLQDTIDRLELAVAQLSGLHDLGCDRVLRKGRCEIVNKLERDVEPNRRD